MTNKTNRENQQNRNALLRAATINGNYKSTLISKNVTVHGRRTSIRLEPEMWSAIKEISKRERCTIHRICTIVSSKKNAATSLTAAIRVFIMSYFRAAATEDGHIRVGHGSVVTNHLSRPITYNNPLQKSPSPINAKSSHNDKPIPASPYISEYNGQFAR